MSNHALRLSKPFLLAFLLLLGLSSMACQQSNTSNINTNTNTANANTSPAANVNASPSVAETTGPGIETKEPDKYRATLVLTAETTGDNNRTIPALSAEVARNGDSRSVAFKLPNGEQVIYLDLPDKRYVILPNRKQYAELTSESLGFNVARLMTPGQIVDQLKRQRGYERVGEEQVDGRTVTKYRFTGTAQTGTAAGEVKSETFVYVDKDTGLPVRSELNSQATGEVKGVKGVKVVAVMKDISTDVAPTQFDIPQGYSKVDPEKLRQQVEALAAVAQVFLNNMLAQSSTSASPNASPTAASSPTPVSP